MHLLHFDEAEPATYPDLEQYDDEGDSLDALVPTRAYWRRIEEHIAHRWTSRQCVWIIRGPGLWESHLAPLSNVTVDVWGETDYTWSSATPTPSPMGGFDFSDHRTYRITATVGNTAEEVPQLIVEAYLRLEAYYEDHDTISIPAGSSSYSSKVGEALTDEITRAPTWIARAMQHSGCADLLRSYRRI